jgi:alpha-ketoglutarate-dependent taurine dioxygenase
VSPRSNSLGIRPLAGAIGAEILGIDLRELDEPMVAAVRRAWLDHLVIFFRNQNLTAGQLVSRLSPGHASGDPGWRPVALSATKIGVVVALPAKSSH